MDDDELRDRLKSVFQHLKAQRGAISALLAEVGALRESLCEIVPKYREIFDRHKDENIQAAEPLVSEDLRRYDEIIEGLSYCHSHVRRPPVHKVPDQAN